MLANIGFLALLLVLPCTVLGVADDDPFLQRIDSFRRGDIVSLNGSFGFERFGRLVNETRKTMEFFGWLGHLFTNGTVGHCNYTIDRRWNCTVVFDNNGSVTLKKAILVLFKEMYAFRTSRGSENFERIFSDKAKIDNDAREMMNKPGALSNLFKLSTSFYEMWDYLETSFVNKTLNDGYKFSAYCYRDWKIRNQMEETTNVIQALTYLMGPGCDRVDDAAGEYDYIGREKYYKIAGRKGLNGGDSNRCLQKFLIRFTDYDKKIYELFVDYLGRYIFQTISFYGYCLPIAFPDQEERESWISWAVESLEVLQTQLVDALQVFNETPSDQPFMKTIDTFRDKNIEQINGSYGFERLRNVVYRTSDVMVFFGWLGSLFTNGVLGHYAETIWREEIFVGADGSQPLKHYVLALFDDMYTFGELMPISNDPFVRVFYGEVDRRPLPFARFFPARRFYYRWIHDVVGVHLNATSSNNDTRGQLTYVRSECRLVLETREEKPPPFNAIKALLYLLKPGCEVEKNFPEWDEFLDRFQEAYNELANLTGFTGGDSNRCFQNFMVRYSDYNRTTYETLVDYMGKFLFQEVSVYGYCLAITRADSGERKRWIEWAEDGLKTIVKLMSDGLEVFNEPRPMTTLTASTISAQYYGQATDNTAATIDRSLMIAILEQAKDTVLPIEGITGSMAWVERAKRHQIIADRIQHNLTGAHNAHYGVSFQVLVSLLQDKAQNDMMCMESKSDRHIKSFNSHGVSYFIQYFNEADLSVGLNATWEDAKLNQGEILNAVFSSKTQDLCKTTKDEIEKAVGYKVFGSEDGFSGLAVVRCGRRFVWYQLGYSYFSVGRTAGPSFTLASGSDETYDSNCGQIFFFP